MKVNGNLVELTNEQTLLDYLSEQGFDLKTIAVERNGEIVPKATYGSIYLDNQDHLEIVRFVGGG